MKIASVTDIVNEYLEQHGYDGLYNDAECACEKDDLAPCGEMGQDCQAGYKLPCDCGEGCDFHIGPRRAASTSSGQAGGAA